MNKIINQNGVINPNMTTKLKITYSDEAVNVNKITNLDIVTILTRVTGLNNTGISPNIIIN